MKIKFFRSAGDLRKWFEKNHSSARELWVGFYRKNSGQPSITWPESVDEALCVGWIDGLRKGVDERSYVIRFSPRRAASTWSAINVRRARELASQGRMQPAGLKAFQARKEDESGLHSRERLPEYFNEPYNSRLKANPAAWNFFQAQSPGYRRLACGWVVSAKREATRLKRLERLAEASARGRKMW